MIIDIKKARTIDQEVNKKLGISPLILMENAGRSVAEEIIKLKKKKVAIFCGKGNNGGDGFVCARHLLSKGIKTDVFLLGKIFEVKNEARINLDILLRLGITIVEINEENFILYRRKIKNYEIIVDAIFGIGLKGKISGIFKMVIEAINSLAKYVISIDIPSGLDADTGKILGCCVKADITVTFIAIKKGMLKNKGRYCCGEISIKDLGFPLRWQKYEGKNTDC